MFPPATGTSWPAGRGLSHLWVLCPWPRQRPKPCPHRPGAGRMRKSKGWVFTLWGSEAEIGGPRAEISNSLSGGSQAGPGARPLSLDSMGGSGPCWRGGIGEGFRLAIGSNCKLAAGWTQVSLDAWVEKVGRPWRGHFRLGARSAVAGGQNAYVGLRTGEGRSLTVLLGREPRSGRKRLC